MSYLEKAEHLVRNHPANKELRGGGHQIRGNNLRCSLCTQATIDGSTRCDKNPGKPAHLLNFLRCIKREDWPTLLQELDESKGIREQSDIFYGTFLNLTK